MDIVYTTIYTYAVTGNERYDGNLEVDIDFDLCSVCGLLVGNREIHTKWHEALAPVIPCQHEWSDWGRLSTATYDFDYFKRTCAKCDEFEAEWRANK